MAANQEPQIFVDGTSSFPKGINSGIPPLSLTRDQLAFAINATTRDDYITHRPCYRRIALSYPDPGIQAPFEQNLFQGGCYYKPDSGSEAIVFQIGGRLFEVTPDSAGGASVIEVTIPGDPNPATITQAWLWQGEKYVFVNDGQSVPIFFDGTISRRSNSTQKILGTVSVATFTPPAIGATVIIPLTTPFLGQIGDSFFINSTTASNGATYQATYPAGAANATLTTAIDLGATHAIGEQVVVNPNNAGRLANFTTFAIASGCFAVNGLLIGIQLANNFTGSVGDILTIQGQNWKVQSFAGDTLLIRNQVPICAPGINYPTGELVQFAGSSFPITVLGTLVAPFTVPATGADVDIQMDVPFTGTNGTIVYVGNGEYTIKQKASPPPGLNVTAININDTSVVAVPGGSTLLSIPELPPGRMGVYGMGRVWECLVDGRSFIGSDIVGSSSGTQANAFRDSILKVTENLYLAGGGFFLVPGNIGNIQAMVFASTLDSSLGQGPLQIYTPTVVFSVNAPVFRTSTNFATGWQDITNPILTESLISNGGLAQNSTIAANGDTLFRSIDGIRSLILARRDFNSWGNVPISHEVQRIIDQDDRSLLQYSSATIFSNRMLMTSKPTQSGQGVFHRGLIALDFVPLSSIDSKSPSVYDGLWTGINTLQTIVGSFSGIVRNFALTYNTISQKIELYEILPDGVAIADRNATDDVPITWQFETSCAFKNVKGKGEFDLVKLMDGEIYVAEVAGRVKFKVEYRGQFDPCWHPWTEFSICASQGASSLIKQQNRVRLGLGRPPIADTCDPQNDRPFFISETFQRRYTITGHCRFYGEVLKACAEPRAFWARPVCGDQDCRLISCDNGSDYDTYLLQDLPLVPTQTFFNDAVFFGSCPNSSTLTYSGTLPAWITIVGNQLVGAAGTFQATSKELANSAAQIALDAFGNAAFAVDALTCVPASNICTDGVPPALFDSVFSITGYVDGEILNASGDPSGQPAWDGIFHKKFNVGLNQFWISGDPGAFSIQAKGMCRATIQFNGCTLGIPQWEMIVRDNNGAILWDAAKAGGIDPSGIYSRTSGSSAIPATVTVGLIGGATTIASGIACAS